MRAPGSRHSSPERLPPFVAFKKPADLVGTINREGVLVETPSSPQRLAYAVTEAARISGLSKSWLYVEMQSGRLAYRKAGTRRLILASDLESYLRSLPSEAA